MPFLFGPVPSRRLGLSLGVDLVKPKTCTFDCIYCEVGRTTVKTIDALPKPDMGSLFDELSNTLSRSRPDVITLAGSGEPTLCPEIGEIIKGIKAMTDIPVVVLTNGSLFWKDEVVNGCLGADIIMPTLSSTFEETFRRIHRPHACLSLERVLAGLTRLRSAYSGRIFLELMMLGGINDSAREIEGLSDAIKRIEPDRIQINTVVRPPAEPDALAVKPERLREIREHLGPGAEIIAGVSVPPGSSFRDSPGEKIIETLNRRPITLMDLAGLTGLPYEETDALVRGLLFKGLIEKREFNGEIFFTGKGYVKE